MPRILARVGPTHICYCSYVILLEVVPVVSLDSLLSLDAWLPTSTVISSEHVHLLLHEDLPHQSLVPMSTHDLSRDQATQLVSTRIVGREPPHVGPTSGIVFDSGFWLAHTFVFGCRRSISLRFSLLCALIYFHLSAR